MVLGQPNPSSGLPNQGLGTSAVGLSNPTALAVTPGGGMLVADQGNNRIVFFDQVPAVSGAAAQAAIGQPNLQASSSALTQARLNGPFGVAVGTSGGASRMAVADAAANRVLIYDRVPVQGDPMPEPVVVIGQPNFESAMPGCAVDRLSFPMAVTITPQGKLIVVDAGNHRVLVWNQVPLAHPVPDPVLVLGQSRLDRCVRNDNDQNGDVPARGTLAFPVDVWSDDNRVVVADAANHRVLVWRNFPSGHLQDADIVLGHSSFTSSAPNDGRAQPTASTLRDPEGVHSDGTALAVADALNHRVLVWPTFPDRDAQPALVVLGHPDFDRSVTNDGNGDGATDMPTAQVLNYPLRVLLRPDALFVSDQVHHRVLRFGR